MTHNEDDILHEKLDRESIVTQYSHDCNRKRRMMILIYSDEGIGGDKIRDMEELLKEVRDGKIIHSFSHLFLHSLFLQDLFHNLHSS